ncbi:hypothetical protein ACFQ3Z_13100 [Streptomyces nogalater]
MALGLTMSRAGGYAKPLPEHREWGQPTAPPGAPGRRFADTGRRPGTRS